jgi:hypothetical protein
VDSVKADDSEVIVAIQPAADNPPKPGSNPIAPAVAVSKTPEKPAKSQSLSNEELWPALLEALKKHHHTLYGIIRMAEPTFTEQNSLKLTFSFALHQKRLSEANNRKLLFETIESLTGRQMDVELILDNGKGPKPKAPPAAVPHDGSLSTINNIFSGAELLES